MQIKIYFWLSFSWVNLCEHFVKVLFTDINKLSKMKSLNADFQKNLNGGKENIKFSNINQYSWVQNKRPGTFINF